MKKKIVVIGSGLGGLAEAIRLQARGFQVTVLEKNSKVGGRAYQLIESGYTFDMGPSLITATNIIRKVFQSAGRNLEDYVELVKLEPFYRIYFHDGTYLDYTDNSEKMKEQIAKFSLHDAENYDKFIEASREIYDVVITDGLGSTPFIDLKTLIQFIPRALKLKAIYSTYHFVKRYFNEPRNRFTFSFHPLFIGGNPFRTPSVYLMIPYLEKTDGVWYSKGGMYSLVRAFEKLFRELGGVIKTDAEVKEIVVDNGSAVGTRTEDEFYEADAVVSNADWAHTNKDLISPEYRSKWSNKRIEKMDYSMSAFLLYIGVRRQYPELLQHHTIILSERYKSLIEDIFERKILPDDFSMYLHVPTRTDSSMAPPGCESMYVLVPVPNLAGQTNWDEIAKSYADKILDFLENDFGLKKLRKSIDVLKIFTPKDFQQKQNAYLGSAWGVEPKLMQTAYFRPHNRSEDIARLYFVGASTHPGAGVPGVLLTAEVTEKVILNDLGIQN